MKILLGDFRIWRIKRFAVISTVIILIIVILSISDIDRARVNTFIIAIALLIIGVIADSKLFRKEYITECEEKGNYVYIKNKKMNRKINRKDISNIFKNRMFCTIMQALNDNFMMKVCWDSSSWRYWLIKKEYELQLPSSYVDIDREEMEYIDGGYRFDYSRDEVAFGANVGLAIL